MRTTSRLVTALALTISFAATAAVADIFSGASATHDSNDVAYSQLTINQPAGVAAGDFMLASVAVNGGSPASLAAPAGWTQILRTDNDTDISLITYYKFAAASEPATYTWTITPQARAEGGITRYSGVDTSSPIAASSSNSGEGKAATALSVTTTATNAQVVAAFAFDGGKNNSGYFSTPAGMTKKYDVTNTPFGPSLALDDMLKTTAGATGNKISNISGGKEKHWVAQQIALKRFVAPISIAYDTGSGAWQQNGSGDQTMSVTLASDTNFLLVGVENGNNQGDTVTGVTWNGVPMTLIGKVGGTARDDYFTYVFGLMNPVTGTHNVVTSGVASGPNVLAAGYKNVRSMPTNIVSNFIDGATASGISNAITTSTTGAWVVGFGAQISNCGNAWTDLISRADDACARSIGDTNGSVLSGSHTYTWSGNGPSNWNLILLEILPQTL